MSDGQTAEEQQDGPDTIRVGVTLSRPVAEQLIAASTLTGEPPERFIDEAILTRLEALDDILHGDASVDVPEDFDAEAWRERYEEIRTPETGEFGE